MVPLPCVALKKPGEWRHKTRDKAASEAFCLCCNSSSCFLWWHLFSHFLILHYWEGLTFYGIAGNVEPSSPLHSAGSAILLGVSSWQWHLRGWWMSVLGGVRVPISFAHHAECQYRIRTLGDAWMHDPLSDEVRAFAITDPPSCRAGTWRLLSLPVALAAFVSLSLRVGLVPSFWNFKKEFFSHLKY